MNNGFILNIEAMFLGRVVTILSVYYLMIIFCLISILLYSAYSLYFYHIGFPSEEKQLVIQGELMLYGKTCYLVRSGDAAFMNFYVFSWCMIFMNIIC